MDEKNILLCGHCGEPWDFLQILNQDLHPEQGWLANTLFLEGVGCPSCEWGSKDILTLPHSSWHALICAVKDAAGVRIEGQVIEEELASKFARVICHPRVPEYLSFHFGVTKIKDSVLAWDWLFGKGFQHRWQALASFASGGSFSAIRLDDYRVMLSRTPEVDDISHISQDRINEGKEALLEIVEPRILKSVMYSCMRARGFSDRDTKAALDAISKERIVYLRPFEHPVLKGEIQISFRPGR